MPVDSKSGDSAPLQGAVVGLASRLSRTYIADLGIYTGNAANNGTRSPQSGMFRTALCSFWVTQIYLSRPVSYLLQDRFPAVSFAQRSDVTQE